MRKEKVLKNRKKTEEEDEFNGLGRKKDGRKKKQIQEAKKKALSDHRWQYTAFIECLSSEYEINSPNAPTFSTIDETLSPMELLLSQLNRKNRENQFAEILEELNIC